MWTSCALSGCAAPRISTRRIQRGTRFICRCNSVRKAKDPKEWASIEDLRADLERSEPGLLTGLVQRLGSAANRTAAGFDLTAAFRNITSGRQKRKEFGSWDDQQEALDELEREIGSETVRQLSVVLLGTRQSTLRIVRRHRPVLEMERSHIMQRLVWLKGMFPGCDVSRMVELQPAALLDGDWEAVQSQVTTASQLLREGLAGADFDFMFQEDPAILFEGHESLRVGLRRLHELWAVDETALSNSDPLHLLLVIRMLGTNGPPKGF